MSCPYCGSPTKKEYTISGLRMEVSYVCGTELMHEKLRQSGSCMKKEFDDKENKWKKENNLTFPLKKK